MGIRSCFFCYSSLSRSILCVAGLSFSLPGWSSPLFSADANANPATEIVITGTRRAQPAASTLAATTVIERDQIEQWQAQSLTDVLQRVPGVAISNNGGAGQPTAVFLRGSEADHVLVLIDGVPAGSVSLGTMAFQDIPLNLVERIEVVRGPASAVYGSDAVGGVIQIFTKGRATHSQQRAQVAAGSNSSYSAAVAHQGVFKVAEVASGQFNVGVSKTQTQGIDATRPIEGFVSDDDANANRSGNIGVDLQLPAGQKFKLSALQANADTEYDDGFSDDKDASPLHANNIQRILSGEASTPLTQNQQLVLTTGQSFDRADNLDGTNLQYFYHTQRDSLALLHHWQPTKQQNLTTGVDYRYDHLESDTEFTQTHRQTESGFMQYQQHWQQYLWQIGARYDDNSQFGDFTTGNLRLGYLVSPQIQYRASIASAYKAPTFNDLYYPGSANPLLKPEESVNYELGVESMGSVQLSLALFQTDFDQLIELDSQYFPRNISQARIIGHELGWKTALDAWALSGQFTWLHTQNRDDGANSGNQLPRRPARSMTLDISRHWQQWSAGALLTANSHRYDDAANTSLLGGYTLLDLRVAREISDVLQIQASVNNLSNKQYETAESYQQLGRTFWLTLRYQADGLSL